MNPICPPLLTILKDFHQNKVITAMWEISGYVPMPAKIVTDFASSKSLLAHYQPSFTGQTLLQK